jgi:Tfp pilus assembly protein PilN
MIEINLMPGSAKRPRRRKRVALPTRKERTTASVSAAPRDPLRVLTLFSVAVSVVAIAWLWFSAGSRTSELQTAIEGAQRDSVRYAAIIAANQQLHDRQTIVAEKLQVIQEIDQARYVWAHLMDEVSRALTPNAWLVNLQDISPIFGSKQPRLRIEGRAGHTYVMTQFMTNLEQSPFIAGVTLINHQQIAEGARTMYSFTLEMNYSEPGPDAVRMVPLFATLEGN